MLITPFLEVVVDSLQLYTAAATNRYLDNSTPWTLLNRVTTKRQRPWDDVRPESKGEAPHQRMDMGLCRTQGATGVIWSITEEENPTTHQTLFCSTIVCSRTNLVYPSLRNILKAVLVSGSRM